MIGRIIIDGVDVGEIVVGPATFVIHQPDADRLHEVWAGGKSVLGEFTAYGTAKVTYTNFGRRWLKRAGLTPLPRPAPRPSRGWRRHVRRMKARAVE